MSFLKVSAFESYMRFLFNSGNIIEIIKFLKKEYKTGGYLHWSRIDFESNEKILLDLNNDLINRHLIRCCKSSSTFYYLLEKDTSLVDEASYNLTMAKYYDHRFVERLVNHSNKTDIITYFMCLNIENYKYVEK